MIDQMSNKSLIWLSGTLIGAIVVVWTITQHMKEINDIWQWARWVLILLALLSILYGVYRLWHAEKLRKFDRLKAAAEVSMIEAEQWAVEQKVLGDRQIEEERTRSRELIELERIRLEQMKLTLEHERLMTAQQNVTLNAGQTFVRVAPDGNYLPYNAPAQLGARKVEQIEAPDELEIPTAPRFLDMCHLITTEKAPLCYDVHGPVYGTVLDLLSMAVSGKPGRGKTTALMYYVAFLLRCGAEVWIFDPHGTMGELSKLNGQVLSNMPATAKVVYLDRQQDMVNAIPELMNELNVRDELYRPAHEVKHPLLVLADELPVIAEFDVDIIHEWKLEDRQERDAHPLTFARLFKKFVLEARKWNCYFIGSGQTFDAETLPKKVTENLASRIVFFSSDQRARMSGLENDAIKTLLPAIRRAGSGVMVFDCTRFDAPIMGAIPYITVDDLMVYLGVARELPGNRHFELERMPDLPLQGDSRNRSTIVIEAPQYAHVQKITGALETPVNALVDDAGMTPDELPAFGNDDLEMTDLQVKQFIVLYPAIGNIVKCLERIDNGKGQGLGKRYHKHASWIVKSQGLKKETR